MKAERINPNNREDLELLIEYISKARGNNLTFIFGERLHWKSALIDLIGDRLKNKFTVFKIDYRQKGGLLEYCYFTAIHYILSKAGIYDLVKFRKEETPKFFSSKRIKRFIQKVQIKNLVKKQTHKDFGIALSGMYRGNDQFSLRYVLSDLRDELKSEIIFLIDDFDEKISEDAINEILSMSRDDLSCHFVITSRPNKDFQRHFNNIDNNFKFNLAYFFLTPLNLFHDLKNIRKVATPWLPGIVTKTTPEFDITEDALFEKIIEHPFYGSVVIDSPTSKEELILLGFTISHGGLRSQDISSILKVSQSPTGVSENKSLWEVGTKWRFLDIWREYLYIKCEMDSILEETSAFLTYMVMLSLKDPSSLKVFDFLNYELPKNALNYEFSIIVDSHFKLINGNIPKEGSVFAIQRTTDFILNNLVDISWKNLDLISHLFENTQNLSLLDYGIEAIEKGVSTYSQDLEKFLYSCAINVRKWNDLSLLIKTENLLNSKDLGINKNKFIRLMRTTLKAFIVHGKDEILWRQLKDYLQNTLKMEEPIILTQVADRGRTVIEKFEEVAEDIDVAVVLLTPDDVAVNPIDKKSIAIARQNVLYELGYFTGKLGRSRTILIMKGDVDIPSDLTGICYIKTTSTITEVGERIRIEVDAIRESISSIRA